MVKFVQKMTDNRRKIPIKETAEALSKPPAKY
jgi:hypothetical protein